MTQLQGAEQIAGMAFIHGKIKFPINALNVQVYPGIGPRAAVVPYVTYQSWPRVGTSAYTTALGGGRVLARLRFRVVVQSETVNQARPILLAIDSALQDAQGPETVSGYYVSNTDLVEPFALPVLEGDEQYWQIGSYWDLTVSEGVT